MKHVAHAIGQLYQKHGAEFSSTALDQFFTRSLLSSRARFVLRPTTRGSTTTHRGHDNAKRRKNLLVKYLPGTHAGSVSKLCDHAIVDNPRGGTMTVLRPLGLPRTGKVLQGWDGHGKPIFIHLFRRRRRSRLPRRSLTAPNPTTSTPSASPQTSSSTTASSWPALARAARARPSCSSSKLLDRLLNYAGDDPCDTMWFVIVATGKRNTADQFSTIFHGKVCVIEGTDSGGKAHRSMTESPSGNIPGSLYIWFGPDTDCT